jgi:hypothetical protein
MSKHIWSHLLGKGNTYFKHDWVSAKTEISHFNFDLLLLLFFVSEKEGNEKLHNTQNWNYPSAE